MFFFFFSYVDYESIIDSRGPVDLSPRPICFVVVVVVVVFEKSSAKGFVCLRDFKKLSCHSSL